MMIRKIYYSIVIFLVFTFGLLTCVGGIFDDMCGNEIIQEIPSPDRKLKAVIFKRNCGATTGYSSQVSILSIAQRLPNVKGNIFITNWEGIAPIEVNWESKEKLRLRYHNNAETFTKEESFHGVMIEYEMYDETRPTIK